jgi:hypothetical protein
MAIFRHLLAVNRHFVSGERSWNLPRLHLTQRKRITGAKSLKKGPWSAVIMGNYAGK